MTATAEQLEAIKQHGKEIRDKIKSIAEVKKRPETRGALRGWIRDYLGFNVPNEAVTPGTQSPMEFISDVFFEKTTDALVLASRSSGKTLDLAILDHILCYFYPGIEITALGAVIDQASKRFSYVKQFVENEYFAGETEPVTTRRIRYHNGSLAHILSGTKSGVNAPHPNVAAFDEVDLIPWGLLQQAFSMAISTDVHAATQILASTRKTMTGVMQKLVRRVKEDKFFPFTIYQWNVFSICEQCKLSSCDACKARIRGDGVSFFDRCQKKAQWSDGFMLLDDVWKKFSILDPFEWDMEWECLHAELSGLVFPRFSEDIHIRLFDPRLGWKTYVACDFGFGPGHPFVALYCQIDPSDNIWVYDELFGEGIDISVWIERIKAWVHSEDEEVGVLPMFQKIFADGHGDQEIRDMRKGGLKKTYGVFVGVDDGAKMIRKWINGAHNDYVHPRIIIHPQCKHLIECLGELKFNKRGEVQELNDDPFDALRYLIKGAGYMDVKANPQVSSMDSLRAPQSQPPTSSEKWIPLAKSVNRPVRHGRQEPEWPVPSIPGTKS